MRTSGCGTSRGLSPDSRWIAYGSDESGRINVYVRSYPDVERGRWQLSNDGGEEPRWSRDGRELFFRTGTHLMAVPVETGEQFSAGTEAELFPITDYFLPVYPQTYDAAPGGQRFLFIKSVERASDGPSPPPMVLIENWSEELTARVPAPK